MEIMKENEDIDRLITILKYLNSDYIDIKSIRKALKEAKEEKEYEDEC